MSTSFFHSAVCLQTFEVGVIKKLYHYQLCFSFQRNEYMHFQSLVIYFCLYYYSSNHDKIGKYFKSKIHISTYYSCAFSPNIGFFVQCRCRQKYPCLCVRSRDKHFSLALVFLLLFLLKGVSNLRGVTKYWICYYWLG